MLFAKKLVPLKYEEIINGLKQLGFLMKPKTGTSHEQWVKYSEDRKRKWLVTVDKHHAPFSRDLIKSMARQAGVEARSFHALCRGTATLKQVVYQTTK
ncbi:type II toxin-antitoxin system HicA family toxin [Pantoea ananatis]|uniref:type II toxin-antitoxin system HicA family toxin n=1 Tax=Pantoea ananas TaxID=553 RepID=UPI001B311D24|nr:type II toxin-antitoxin system HicA family toxin [Pantoea ananatis]